MSAKKMKWFILCALALALALAAFVSPFASKAPDGLDKVAEEQGIAESGEKAWTHAPLAEYRVGAIASESVSTGVSGILGTVLVFGLAFGVAKLAAGRKGQAGKLP